MASGSRIVRSMPIQVCQEELIGTFKSLCPFKDWSTFKFPMIEDLINQPVFLRFASWRREHGFWDGMPAGPRKVGLEERAYFRMSVGTQTGAASSGKAAPPLVPFGLGPDGHFQFASMVQSVGTPFEIEPIVDDDLAFASFTSAASGLDIRKIRTHSLRILEELGRRWGCVTEALVSCQPWEVRMATSGRHIALIGLLAIMIDWPDPSLMRDLVLGFPGVGYSKHVPVYASQPASWIPLDDLLDYCHGRCQTDL